MVIRKRSELKMTWKREEDKGLLRVENKLKLRYITEYNMRNSLSKEQNRLLKTKIEDGIPIFKTKKDEYGHAVFKCPVCGKLNFHSYESGYRMSHCPCWNPGGYKLICDDNKK